jgi:hypothetical protein
MMSHSYKFFAVPRRQDGEPFGSSEEIVLHSSGNGDFYNVVRKEENYSTYNLFATPSKVDIELRNQDRRRVLVSLEFPSDKPEGRTDDRQKQVTMEGPEVDGMRTAVTWRFYAEPYTWLSVSACIKVRPKRVAGLVKTACQLKYAMQKRESEGKYIYLLKRNEQNAKRRKIQQNEQRLAAIDENVRKLQAEQDQLLAEKAQLLSDPPASNEAHEADLDAFMAAA